MNFVHDPLLGGTRSMNFKHVLTRAVSWIDLADITFVVGLLLLGYGLWRIYEPLAFVVTGAVLVGLVLIPRLRRKEK